MLNIDEFRKYLVIDKLALDDEVVRQPSLFFEVGEAYTEAAADRDALKEALASVDAKLDTEARRKLGDKKATEGQIKAEIQSSPKHTKAFEGHLAAKELADKLSVLKDAFQQRSYMLRALSQLHATNYFEDTSVRSNAQQDRQVYETRRAKLAAGRK